MYITSTTRTSVSVAWDSAYDGNSAVTGYTVGLYGFSTTYGLLIATPVATQTVSALTRTATFTGLDSTVAAVAGQALTYYAAGVSATNGIGTGGIQYTTSESRKYADYNPGAGTPAIYPGSYRIPLATQIVFPGFSSITPGGNSLTVTWTIPTDLGGQTYTGLTLYIWTEDLSYFSTATITSTSQTSYTFTGLTSTHLYTVAAFASYFGGTVASVTGTPLPVTVTNQPTGLNVTPGQRSASLYWTAPTILGNTTVTNYFVEYSTDGGTTWSGVLTGSATAATVGTPYIANAGAGFTLTYAVSATFRVSAVNSAGRSAASSTVSVTPTATAPAVPAAPAVDKANNSLVVTWTAPSADNGASITGYSVQWSTSSTFASITGSSSTASLTTTITGLTNGTTYYVRVASVNAAGTSAYSSGTSGVPTDVPTSAILAYVGNSTGTAKLTSSSPYTSFSARALTSADWTSPSSAFGSNPLQTSIVFDGTTSGRAVGWDNGAGTWIYTTDAGVSWTEFSPSIYLNAAVTLSNTLFTGSGLGTSYNTTLWNGKVLNGDFVWASSTAIKGFAGTVFPATTDINSATGIGVHGTVAYDIAYSSTLSRYVIAGRNSSNLFSASYASTLTTNPYTAGSITREGSTTSLSAGATSVTWGSSSFVAVGGSIISTLTGPHVYQSTDGISWTQMTVGNGNLPSGLPAASPLLSIAYGASKFVAVGANGLILSSNSTGTVWTQSTSGVTTAILQVIYWNSAFWAITSDGKILTSTTGTGTWTTISPTYPTGITNTFSGFTLAAY